MLKLIELALLPVRYIWVLGLALAIGFGTGIVNLPGVSAQVALDCRGEIIDNECVQQADACWNLDDYQSEVPEGYHIDQTQDNACVADPTPQVLGESTTPEPQALAETTGK